MYLDQWNNNSKRSRTKLGLERKCMWKKNNMIFLGVSSLGEVRDVGFFRLLWKTE